MSGYFADASGTEKSDVRGEDPREPIRTIPGTFDDYSRCDYDELCSEARDAIDAVVRSHAHGSRMDGDTAMMLLRFLGMCDVAAADLLSAERDEASQP